MFLAKNNIDFAGKLHYLGASMHFRLKNIVDTYEIQCSHTGL